MRGDMKRDEIVTALRCCAADYCNGCQLYVAYPKGGDCIRVMATAAADLIENQQREIEALRQANEGLRFNLAALSTPEGKR